MLAVTVRSCIEELRPVESGDIVICDNSDEDAFKLLDSVIPTGYVHEGKVKIIRQGFPCLFTARESAARHSNSEYILCVDSHMIIGRNMILDLVNFMDRHKDDPTVGFAHAPVSWTHQHERVARHDRDMSQCELGGWNTRYDYEKMITWKGMPWICRRKWFLDKENGLGGYGALSEHKLSWGGGDLHIGVKPWMLGFKNWAVPTSPGIHIGPFPRIDITGKNPNVVRVARPKYPDDYKYRLWSVSGVGPHAIGFLVSCYVLGGVPMMRRNKQAIHERFSKFIDVDKWWQKAIIYGTNEKKWLDSKKKITFEQLLQQRPWDKDGKGTDREGSEETRTAPL